MQGSHLVSGFSIVGIHGLFIRQKLSIFRLQALDGWELLQTLFVKDYYKNLAAFSKMRNVGGISQTEAQKSSDLYMKCRYLDEITGGRGVLLFSSPLQSDRYIMLNPRELYHCFATANKLMTCLPFFEALSTY